MCVLLQTVSMSVLSVSVCESQHFADTFYPHVCCNCVLVRVVVCCARVGSIGAWFVTDSLMVR